MEPELKWDTREFQQAMQELENELPITNNQVITNTARKFLGNTVNVMPVRTGNLASAARPAWQKLELPGEPKTTVPTGEKKLTYIDKRGYPKEITVKSEGDFVDQRLDRDKALFRFRMYAWELRASGWHPYSFFNIYGRRVITAAKDATKFQWSNAYERLLAKRSGK